MSASPSENNTQAAELLNRAVMALHTGNVNEAHDLIAQAERLSCSAYTTPNCQFTMLLLFTMLSDAQRPIPIATGSNAGITPPAVISKEEPVYSKAAQEAGLEGTVLLSAVVDEQGVPEDVSVVKSLGMGWMKMRLRAFRNGVLSLH